MHSLFSKSCLALRQWLRIGRYVCGTSELNVADRSPPDSVIRSAVSMLTIAHYIVETLLVSVITSIYTCDMPSQQAWLYLA